MSKKSFVDIACGEPYRIFFPLGILLGIVGISHWFFYAVGWQKAYSGFYHSSVQMMGYMACFVTGFLLTAMPRFSGSTPARPTEVATFLVFILAIFASLSFGRWINAEIIFIGWLMMLGYFGISRIKKNQTGVSPPGELVWIPIALIHGITGSLLLILSQSGTISPWFAAVGKPMLEQGFLFSIVIGIGGFLIPRIMGVKNTPASEEACMPGKVIPALKNGRAFNLLLGLLLFLSFWLEALQEITFAYALRAAIAALQFSRNGIITGWPRVPYLFVKLAWLSVWMIIVGYAAVSLFPVFRVAFIHIVFMGGFSLMTFSIATMVVMSHAGEAEKLRRPLAILKIVTAGLFLALAKRIIVIFFPDSYFQFLGIAALVWIFVAVSWLCFVAPLILQVPEEADFNQMHEEAKQRLLADVQK